MTDFSDAERHMIVEALQREAFYLDTKAAEAGKLWDRTVGKRYGDQAARHRQLADAIANPSTPEQPAMTKPHRQDHETIKTLGLALYERGVQVAKVTQERDRAMKLIAKTAIDRDQARMEADDRCGIYKGEADALRRQRDRATAELKALREAPKPIVGGTAEQRQIILDALHDCMAAYDADKVRYGSPHGRKDRDYGAALKERGALADMIEKEAAASRIASEGPATPSDQEPQLGDSDRGLSGRTIVEDDGGEIFSSSPLVHGVTGHEQMENHGAKLRDAAHGLAGWPQADIDRMNADWCKEPPPQMPYPSLGPVELVPDHTKLRQEIVTVLLPQFTGSGADMLRRARDILQWVLSGKLPNGGM